MPRNVRNYWLELEIDGRKTRVETGPRAKDGGFSLNIYMRNKGNVTKIGRLIGMPPDNNGKLHLKFIPNRHPNHVEMTGYVRIETSRD